MTGSVIPEPVAIVIVQLADIGLFQVHSVLWVPDSGCLYTLSTCGLNKWEVGDTTEVQVLSWNACPSLFDNIADAIWVRDVI